MNQERRAGPRVSFEGEAIVWVGQKRLQCTAVDLSAGGMLLLPPARAQPGLPMRIDFCFPGMEDWVSVEAALVREARHFGRYGWGIRFNRMAPYVGTMLRNFVRRATRGEVEEPRMSENAQPLHAEPAVAPQPQPRPERVAAKRESSPGIYASAANIPAPDPRGKPTREDIEAVIAGMRRTSDPAPDADLDPKPGIAGASASPVGAASVPGQRELTAEDLGGSSPELDQHAGGFGGGPIQPIDSDPFADLPVGAHVRQQMEGAGEEADLDFDEDERQEKLGVQKAAPINKKHTVEQEIDEGWSSDPSNLKKLYEEVEADYDDAMSVPEKNKKGWFW